MYVASAFSSDDSSSISFLLNIVASIEELIVHGLHALRETLQQDKELTVANTSIGIVGPPAPSESAKGSTSKRFRILEGEAIDVFLKKLPPKEIIPGSAPAPTDDTEDVEMAT